MNRVAAYLLLAVCTLLPIAAQTMADERSGWMLIDFRAYYCATLIQREAGDPYSIEPLHTCERSTPHPFYRAAGPVTVPAPYPPYALALLSPLTLLPFRVAAFVWIALLTAGVAIAAWALARMTDRPFAVGWAAFALALGLASIPGGNAMPIAVAFVTLCAFFAQRGNAIAASVCIGLATIEPNVALPGAIGLFVAVGRARVPMVAIGALLGALSLIAAGLARNVQYLHAVLPAHALSEVSRDNQYSLSTVVAAMGATDRVAIEIGTASYAVAVLCGVIVGLRLARRFANPAFAVAIPVAFGSIGGTFVHTEAIAAAVPAAMLLSLNGGRRGLALLSLLLICVPWMFATSASLLLAPAVPVAYLIRSIRPLASRLWIYSASAAFVAIVALHVLATPADGHVQAVFDRRMHPPIDPRLAEAAWRELVLGNSTNRLVTWLLRLPTWAGLVALAVVAVQTLRQKPWQRDLADPPTPSSRV